MTKIILSKATLERRTQEAKGKGDNGPLKANGGRQAEATGNVVSSKGKFSL